MKRILTLLLMLVMLLTLVGCKADEQIEEPTIKEQETQEPSTKEEEPVKEEVQIVGGWTDAEDSTITDELKDIFNEALKGLLGASYEPKELIATQVVNGINYKFLAEGKKTTNPITKGTYYVTVNKSATGEISLVDIETIEEKQEEVKTTNQDITQMYFWVVTFDQYGNEVDRYTSKYGSTVYNPSTNEAVIVKGNTRFYVNKDYSVYSEDSSSSSPTPSPTPAPGGVNYLYFKNIGAIDATFKLCTYGNSSLYDSLKFQYSNDKENWIDITFNTDITAVPNETLYIKAKTSNDHVYYYPESGGSGGVYFDSDDDNTSSLEVGGSVMTLLDPTDTLRDLTGKPGCFYYLFYDMYNLKNADNLELPATTLSYCCYGEMFENDYYLETVNEDLVSAVTDLSTFDYCYYCMFYYCQSLTNAPTLPATTLSEGCYDYMFYDCEVLNDHIVLPATELADYCYYYMFDYCYLFNSLEVAFDSFDSLPTDATTGWLNSVAASGTFKWPGSLSIATRDVNTVPSGWTITN